MKYRIILKVGYYSTWFDFDDIGEAWEFAKQMLIHHVPNEDTEKIATVKIEIVSGGEENNE